MPITSPPLARLARHLCPRCTRRLPVARRTFTSSPTVKSPPPPLRLAIIGAGPSGFYTASRVLSSLPPDSPSGQNVEVHMYERIPTPYGLVRYGVAPDHPEVKNCQHKFDELAKDSRFKYFGNVLITSQPSIPSPDPTTINSATPPTALSSYTYPHALTLPLTSLVHHYNALLLSYGASLSNPLSSVPGSSSSPSPLSGVFPALALVGWYNGHPAFADLPVDLNGVEEVAVVGQGNVALDVARILLKKAEDLSGTDIPDEILHALSKSDVKTVRAVGRRGPAQVAFTTKELREIVSIPDVGYEGLKGTMMDEAKVVAEGDRMRTRILGLMEKDNQYLGGEKRFILDFLKSPTAFLDGGSSVGTGDAKVGQVEWALNELSQNADKGVVARQTGEKMVTRADMVVESVGYRSEPLGPIEEGGWSLPFDRSKGRVKNTGGRVVGEDGQAIPGIYAAGWVARGPIGVIASTMHDAYSVADDLLADHYSSTTPWVDSPLSRSPESGLPAELEQGMREGKVVDLEMWGKIDEAERERGRTRGKEREKFRRVEEMLAVLS